VLLVAVAATLRPAQGIPQPEFVSPNYVRDPRIAIMVGASPYDLPQVASATAATCKHRRGNHILSADQRGHASGHPDQQGIG
jgi:hypothetical protein